MLLDLKTIYIIIYHLQKKDKFYVQKFYRKKPDIKIPPVKIIFYNIKLKKKRNFYQKKFKTLLTTPTTRVIITKTIIFY